MNDMAYASHAHLLIWLIAALIPLLIWAFRDADQRLASRRAPHRRRGDDRR